MRSKSLTNTADLAKSGIFCSHGVLLSVAMIFLVVGVHLTADAQTLSIIGEDGDSINLTVPDSGDVPLAFHHTPTDGISFDIDLSSFLSEDDQPASVTIGTSDEPNPVNPTRLVFPQDQHRAVLELHAPDLIPGVNYVGTLTASSPQDLKPWTVTLHRPYPRAELVTDREPVELDIEIYSLSRFLLDLFGVAADTAEFSLSLHEKSRDITVEGITIRRAEGSDATSAIDIQRNLRFELDGKPVANLSSWPVTDQEQTALRNILPGEQRSLRVSVVDLPRGEHKIVLQLDALNAKPDTAPKIKLTVRVQHSITWAVLLLIFAIVLSIFFTTVIVNWRQRLALHKRAETLRREWLQDLRALAPVVWLKATRRQAEMTLEKFALLRAPDELAERLDKAARLLTLLRRYRDLQKHMARRSFPYMEHWRLGREIDDIVRRIEPDLLDEANLAAIGAEFDAFQQGLADNVALYKPLVMEARQEARKRVSKPWLDGVLNEVNADSAEKKNLRTLLQKYIEQEPSANPDEDELVVLDRVCSGFRVLKRHSDDSDHDTLRKLVDLIARADATTIQIDRVFDLTNKTTWNQVQKEVNENRRKLSPSSQSPTASPVEPLTPTRFEINLENDKLNDRFVVRSRMTADWSFKLTPKKPRRRLWPLKAPKAPDSREWSKRTKGPTIVQFASEPGTLETEVTLGYDNHYCKPIKGELVIQPSKSNIYKRLVAKGEFALMLVSMAIALVSGLVLYYVPKPVFGALQDYLALFTWGVGVDQGKNLVQTFQNLKGQSKVDSSDA